MRFLQGFLYFGLPDKTFQPLVQQHCFQKPSWSID
jgi:hypothetical protein